MKATVLHTVNYGDSSIIARLFVEDIGATSVMLKGIKSQTKKSSLTMYEPLQYLDISLDFREGRKFNYVKSTALNYPIQGAQHPAQHAQRFLLAEILNQLLQQEEYTDGLMELVFNFLDGFYNKPYHPNAHLMLLKKLTRYLGVYPGKTEDWLDFDADLQMINRFWNEDYEPINRKERSEVMEYIITYLTTHLEGFKRPKSLAILSGLME